ncbi:MAG: glycosyltransferase [Patescibacteria group bacterium]
MKRIGLYIFLYVITTGIIASVFILAPQEAAEFPHLRAFIIVFATILLTKYFVYMMIAPWHDVINKITASNREMHRTDPYTPRVSIIIPAWNEEVGILKTIKTILKSTYRNIEVVVVNDGSTDGSDQAMRKFIETYETVRPESVKKIDLRYFYKENGGKGNALNYGIEHSSGEIVMSIDADCALTPETVGNFVKCFEDSRVMAAVGNVKIGNSETILGTVQYLEFLFSFYFKKAESVMNTIYIIGGAAGAFRRKVFEEVGLYNHNNITEDIEFSVRIQDKGMRIVYASDAIVYTEGASSLAGLMKQRVRWKRGRFQTFRQHRHLFFSTNPAHNKILTWIMLPLAIFGEVQLFLEIQFLAFLYVYSYLTNDFSSFISGILVVSTMFFVQMFFDDNSTKNARFYVLAPIGWLLFYVSTLVEYNALIKSVGGAVRGHKPVWQKWDRKGLPD